MRQYFSAKARLGWDWREVVTLAKSHLESGEDAWQPDHDWDAALKKMGMRREVRLAILNPEFDAMRLMGTAQHWAIDTVEMRWESLESLDRMIKRKAGV